MLVCMERLFVMYLLPSVLFTCNSVMQFYQKEDYLTGKYCFFEYDPKVYIYTS